MAMFMGEIGWGKAFGYAISYVIYVILWLIIGGILFGIGYYMIEQSTEVKYGLWEPPEVKIDYGKLIVGIILVLIGLIIIILSSMATFFKLMSRLISESIPKTLVQRFPPA
jgi:large-conductance mechanosensitive channel